MKTAHAITIVLFFSGCDGFIGEGEVSLAIAHPDYLVLRAVTQTPGPGLTAATVDGQTVYYDPTMRIMDLRHFDPRTATVEEAGSGMYVVSIETTPEGDQILGTWTSSNLQNQLGVFLDGRLLSAPYIQTKISGMIVIEHELTKARAETIAARLRRGGAAE